MSAPLDILVLLVVGFNLFSFRIQENKLKTCKVNRSLIKVCDHSAQNSCFTNIIRIYIYVLIDVGIFWSTLTWPCKAFAVCSFMISSIRICSPEFIRIFPAFKTFLKAWISQEILSVKEREGRIIISFSSSAYTSDHADSLIICVIGIWPGRKIRVVQIIGTRFQSYIRENVPVNIFSAALAFFCLYIPRAIYIAIFRFYPDIGIFPFISGFSIPVISPDTCDSCGLFNLKYNVLCRAAVYAGNAGIVIYDLAGSVKLISKSHFIRRFCTGSKRKKHHPCCGKTQ